MPPRPIGGSGHLLARVNFPLYCVQNLSARHILVAGGGGQAKTGITNTIEIYELIHDSHAKTCRAQLVTHFDTGSRAIMNAAVKLYHKNHDNCQPNGKNTSHQNHLDDHDDDEDIVFDMVAGGLDGVAQLYQGRLVINGCDDNGDADENGEVINGEVLMRNGFVKKERERNLSGGSTVGADGLRRRRTSSTNETFDGKENDVNEANGDVKMNGDATKFNHNDDCQQTRERRDSVGRTRNLSSSERRNSMSRRDSKGRVINGGGSLNLHQSRSRTNSKNFSEPPPNTPFVAFDLVPIKSWKTDFNTRDDPFQKVTRFASVYGGDGHVVQLLLITGGADGHVRVWKYSDVLKMTEEHCIQPLVDIEAHADECDDLDVNPLGSQIVTVSRDGHGYIWKLADGKKVCELKYEIPGAGSAASGAGAINQKNGLTANACRYNFRACRFAMVEGDRFKSKLFTIMNPVVRQKPAKPCYLAKWDTTRYVIEKMVNTGTNLLSAMAVNEDGRFIALGTLSGSVDVYIAFSLQKLYHMSNAHNIFITGLQFLKNSEETQQLTGGQEASLVSVSVDNHIVVHHIPYRATLGPFGSFVFFSAFLFFVYLCMYIMGL